MELVTEPVVAVPDTADRVHAEFRDDLDCRSGKIARLWVCGNILRMANMRADAHNLAEPARAAAAPLAERAAGQHRQGWAVPGMVPTEAVRDHRFMDDNNEFHPESIEPSDDPGVRISALNGATIIVRTDLATRLVTLDLEDPEGMLVASRVLGGEDLQRLVDALTEASERAHNSDGPVVVDVSQVIGRD